MFHVLKCHLFDCVAKNNSFDDFHPTAFDGTAYVPIVKHFKLMDNFHSMTAMESCDGLFVVVLSGFCFNTKFIQSGLEAFNPLKNGCN